MAKKKETVSRRKLLREQRAKRQRQQRVTLIIGATVVAIVIAAFLILPSLLEAMTPVGEITVVTPKSRPMVDGSALGVPEAPVLVEVWEDFQCPACRDYSQNIEPRIVDDYVANGTVRYVFRQFPFIDNRVASKESDDAANASLCAAEQGLFWEYHDMLFANWKNENAGAFSNKRLMAFAEALQIDMTQFEQCFDQKRYQTQIDQDIAAGEQAGVTGTPSVAVNGQIITPGYVPSYEELAQAINSALTEGN